MEHVTKSRYTLSSLKVPQIIQNGVQLHSNVSDLVGYLPRPSGRPGIANCGRPAGYPPGPATLPILGNIHLVKCLSQLVKMKLTDFVDAILTCPSPIPKIGSRTWTSSQSHPRDQDVDRFVQRRCRQRSVG